MFTEATSPRPRLTFRRFYCVSRHCVSALRSWQRRYVLCIMPRILSSQLSPRSSPRSYDLLCRHALMSQHSVAWNNRASVDFDPFRSSLRVAPWALSFMHPYAGLFSRSSIHDTSTVIPWRLLSRFFSVPVHSVVALSARSMFRLYQWYAVIDQRSNVGKGGRPKTTWASDSGWKFVGADQSIMRRSQRGPNVESGTHGWNSTCSLLCSTASTPPNLIATNRHQSQQMASRLL